jgi:hypothetical protein
MSTEAEDLAELVRVGEAFAALQKTEGFAILIGYLKRRADEAAESFFADPEKAEKEGRGKEYVKALYQIVRTIPVEVEARVRAAAEAINAARPGGDLQAMRSGGGSTAVG